MIYNQQQVANLKTDFNPASSVSLIIPVGTNIYPGIYEDVKDKFPAAFGVLEIFGQSEARGVCKALANLTGLISD